MVHPSRFEDYTSLSSAHPYRLYAHLRRTRTPVPPPMNWHEDPEIQFCTAGSGTVTIGAQTYSFSAGDVIAVAPDSLHRTETEGEICYSALIIQAEYCRHMGMDFAACTFPACIRDPVLFAALQEIDTLETADVRYRTARQHHCLLHILLHLAEQYGDPAQTPSPLPASHRYVREAIRYIRLHYAEKISLSTVSAAIYMDKFTLSREFTHFCGCTVTEYINSYRCYVAAELLRGGMSVTATAHHCGFENLSYFTRTYRRYCGRLPSHTVRLDHQRNKE